MISKSSILSIYKAYTLELGIIASVSITLGIGVIMYTRVPSASSEDHNMELSQHTDRGDSAEQITVDIEGAVKKPGVYSVPFGSRIHDLIDRAGGTTATADQSFLARSVNQSQVLNDQDKLYIPSAYESIDTPVTPLVNVNTATIDELDTLPKIGATTAKKIIDNRPYRSTSELLEKKILSQSVYDGIKDQIAAK